MAKVMIIGGHGNVALFLAPLLVERGDEVTSVFRRPEQEPVVSATGALPVAEDVEKLNGELFADLLLTQDAVVWSAGAGGGDPARTYAVDRDAAIRSMDAAKEAGVGRYVMVSYLRARPGHGVPKDDPFHPYVKSKLAADEHLRGSGLDYTILAPDVLTMDEPTGRIDVLTRGLDEERSTVSRADVAAVAAAVLADDTTVNRTIAFRTGDTPIPEAVRG